jgi:hypothetical protein
MPWTVEYRPEKDMALVVAAGRIFDEDARAQLVECIRLLKHHHAALLLLDYSEALSEVPLAGLFGLPDYATELGAPWNMRVAVVLPRTGYRMDTYEFLELVGKNAGYDVRLFGDRKAAEAWFLQCRPALATAAQHAPR